MGRGSRGSALATLLVVGSTAACDEPRPRTEVVVEVIPDAEVEAAADSLLVEVFGIGASRTQRFMQQLDLAAAGVDWPVSLGLVPLRGDADRTFEVVARARSGSDELAAGRLISGYLEGQTLRVSLRLWSVCRDVPCEADETCDRLGLCVPAEVDPCSLSTVGGRPARCSEVDAGTPPGTDCVIGTPGLVPSVNTPASECCPSLSADGLELYFARIGDGIYVARRADPRQPFGAARSLATINPGFEVGDIEPAISASGLSLYYESGAGDLVVASRTNLESPFAAGSPVPGEVGTLGDPTGPDVTMDELLLLVSAGAEPNRDLYLLERTDALEPFAAPLRLEALVSPQNDHFGALTADGLGIYFERDDAAGGYTIWYATRTSRGALFGAPARVTELDGEGDEGDPDVSYDGAELYFASDRPGGAGGNDIWVAARMCR